MAFFLAFFIFFLRKKISSSIFSWEPLLHPDLEDPMVAVGSYLFTHLTCKHGWVCPELHTNYILHTIYYVLYTIYSILYTIYYMLYAMYFILFTIYSILYTVYYCMLYTVYCLLYTVYYILCTMYYVLIMYIYIYTVYHSLP